MKSKYRFLTTCCFMLLFGVSWGQQYSKLQLKGDQFLKKDQYTEAIAYFSSLDSITKLNDPLYEYYMGVSYFISPNEKEKGIPHLENYLEKVDSIHMEDYGHHHIYYILGKLYHLSYSFSKAEEMYTLFATKISKTLAIPEKEKAEMILNANRSIEQCKFGRIAMNNPRHVIIESLGDSINTIYPEYAAIVSQDEKILLFTSRRPDTKGGKKDKSGQFFEDIYRADLLQNTSWTHVILQGQKYSQSGITVYPTLSAQIWIDKAKQHQITPILFPEHPQKGSTTEGKQVHDIHIGITTQQKSCIAPVGLTWNKVSQIEPLLNLHNNDGNHANLMGQLLTSYVFYEVITGESADLLPFIESIAVTESNQQILRQLASETIQANLPCLFDS